MKTLEQQILSCMTVRLTEQFPALAPAFSLLSFQESENMGTDGSCFYYEKTALRNAFLENRLDFLFSTASPICFFSIFSGGFRGTGGLESGG